MMIALDGEREQKERELVGARPRRGPKLVGVQIASECVCMVCVQDINFGVDWNA